MKIYTSVICMFYTYHPLPPPPPASHIYRRLLIDKLIGYTWILIDISHNTPAWSNLNHVDIESSQFTHPPAKCVAPLAREDGDDTDLHCQHTASPSDSTRRRWQKMSKQKRSRKVQKLKLFTRPPLFRVVVSEWMGGWWLAGWLVGYLCQSLMCVYT